MVPARGGCGRSSRWSAPQRWLLSAARACRCACTRTVRRPRLVMLRLVLRRTLPVGEFAGRLGAAEGGLSLQMQRRLRVVWWYRRVGRRLMVATMARRPRRLVVVAVVAAMVAAACRMRVRPAQRMMISARRRGGGRTTASPCQFAPIKEEGASPAAHDVRPVGMGGSVKRMFDRARSKMAKSQVCATCEPTQLAAGTRGGWQSFGMQVTLALALAPDFVCLQIDDCAAAGRPGFADTNLRRYLECHLQPKARIY